MIYPLIHLSTHTRTPSQQIHHLTHPRQPLDSSLCRVTLGLVLICTIILGTVLTCTIMRRTSPSTSGPGLETGTGSGSGTGHGLPSSLRYTNSNSNSSSNSGNNYGSGSGQYGGREATRSPSPLGASTYQFCTPCSHTLPHTPSTLHTHTHSITLTLPPPSHIHAH